MAETFLSQTLEITNDASTYDANVKYLLSDKQLLAYILKYAVTEFQDMTISKVIESIGDDIEVGTRPIDPGLSNLGHISGANTEDNIPGEGFNVYDIRFSAYIKDAKAKILINVEAQKSIDPSKLGYHLENRIIFYLSRMISAQKLTEFFHQDYDNLKKVRSIWICIGDNDNGNSIEEISLNTKKIFGDDPIINNTDLIKGIIIHIRNRTAKSNSKNMLVSMLENLFSEMELSEKKRILTEEYGLVMTTKLEGGINKMCNLSEAIFERGVKEERFSAIERMFKAGATKDQILSYGYTEDELSTVEKSLCTYA